MSDSLNPFSEYNVEENESINVSPISNGDGRDINIDSIATYLLQRKYLLTALELNTELQEAGKKVPLLQNFFSNPSNFETHTKYESSGSLYRSGSCSTFDSLDLTRYSDDGTQQVDDRIAVLEFELRKANDTIKSLRENLTNAVGQDSQPIMNGIPTDKSEGNIDHDEEPSEATPLEKRAMNFLISEYLMQNNFTLTSITFADENENQDFDDWDDVGLNMPKPAGLLQSYRDYNSRSVTRCTKCDTIEAKLQSQIEGFKTSSEDANSENDKLKLEIDNLKKELQQIKTENNELNHKLNLKQTKAEKSSPKVAEQSRSSQTELSDCTSNDEPVVLNSQSSDIQSRSHEMFWDELLRLPSDDENWLLRELCEVPATSEDVVKVLGRCLPHIIPTVLLTKREQLMPLLLSTAALHPDPKVRNRILHDLFNLIKKPDERQRQMILHGCATYARTVGMQRTEEELLPQIWEQLSHKYLERRVLVAEAAGIIAPFIQVEMTSSLLLSILQQMQQEETMEEVKEAISKALAVVIAILQDDDKFNTVFEMVKSYLGDESMSVRFTSRNFLLPSLAMWCDAKNTLHSVLIPWLLARFRLLHEEKASNMTEEYSQYCEDLKVALMHLYVAVLKSIPSREEVTEQDIEQAMNKLPKSPYPLSDASVLLGGDKQLAMSIVGYNAVISCKQYHDNQLLSWIFKRFLVELFQIVCQVDPKHLTTVHSLCLLYQFLSTIFGETFTEMIWDNFNPMFKSESIETTSFNADVPQTTAAVAVFASGVLALRSNSSQKDGPLHTYLTEVTLSLASNHCTLDSLSSAFTELRIKGFENLLADVVLDLVPHNSWIVRKSLPQLCQSVIAEDVNVEFITRRILPMLTTLAKDRKLEVRNATISGLGSVVECPLIPVPVVEDVISLLEGFLSNDDANHDTNVQLVRTMAAVAPKSHPKFQHEFAVPVLSTIAAKNNDTSNRTKKSDIALELLKAYTNLSCCYMSTSLLSDVFIPGLRCLSHDMEELHPEYMDVLSTLLKEMESKINGSQQSI